MKRFATALGLILTLALFVTDAVNASDVQVIRNPDSNRRIDGLVLKSPIKARSAGAKLEGEFDRTDWSLMAGKRTLLRAGRSKKRTSFSLPISLGESATSVGMLAIGPKGELRTEQLWLRPSAVPSAKLENKNHEAQVRPTGLSYSFPDSEPEHAWRTIELKWNAVPGIENYLVELYSKENRKFEALKMCSTQNIHRVRVPKGKKLAWKVTALKECPSRNPASVVSVVGQDPGTQSIRVGRASDLALLYSDPRLQIEFGLGYGTLSADQTTELPSSRFVSGNSQASALGAFSLSGEWWPKAKSSWWGIGGDVLFISAKGTFTNASGNAQDTPVTSSSIGGSGKARWEFLPGVSLVGGFGLKATTDYFIELQNGTPTQNAGLVSKLAGSASVRYEKVSSPVWARADYEMTQAVFSEFGSQGWQLSPSLYYRFRPFDIGLKYVYSQRAYTYTTLNPETQQNLSSSISESDQVFLLVLKFGFY